MAVGQAPPLRLPNVEHTFKRGGVCVSRTPRRVGRTPSHMSARFCEDER
jgi:hypothetical protein